MLRFTVARRKFDAAFVPLRLLTIRWTGLWPAGLLAGVAAWYDRGEARAATWPSWTEARMR